MRWSAAVAFLLGAVAFSRGRVDGVALLAVVVLLGALVRWLVEVSRGRS